MSSTQELASRFSPEMRRAAKTLSNDNHFAILALLIREGSLSFNQIKNELQDLHQQSLSNALSKLQEGGYTVREETIRDGSVYSTQYRVTELGERILSGFLDAFEPRRVNAPTVLDGSGHQYHESPNPYTATTKTPQNATSVAMSEASQIGGPTGIGAPNSRVEG